MDLMKLVTDLFHVIQITFGLFNKSKLGEVDKLETRKVVSIPDKKVASVVDQVKKESTKQVEAIQNEMLKDKEVPKIETKEERMRRILDLITDQILSQGYKDSENFELNLIAPENAKYILTQGAGVASEYTEQKIQRLNKTEGFGYLYAEWETYYALSAQWRKEFSDMIKNEGKTFTAENGNSIVRAKLHELWRQTVWADPKFADEWLRYARISDAELYEFLLTLATDDIEFLPKTDKRYEDWRAF